MPTPDARASALDIVRFTDDGRYRPLRTAPDLRTGWHLANLDRDGLWEALSILYPAAILHAYQRLNRTLEIVDYRPWAARQTAMYASVQELDDTAVATVVQNICTPCLRQKLWQISDNADCEPEPAGNYVPCREPCTVFATEARVVAVERKACRNAASGPA